MATIVFYPTAITSDNSAGGSVPWVDPGNAAAEDAAVATATEALMETPAVKTSLTLKAGTFKSAGMTIAELIAAGATLNSVKASVKRNANASGAGRYAKDLVVSQFYGGAYAGANLADTENYWPGPPDLLMKDYTWSEGLPSTAQLRAADYAIGVQAHLLPATDAAIIASIDVVALTVDYDAPVAVFRPITTEY